MSLGYEFGDLIVIDSKEPGHLPSAVKRPNSFVPTTRRPSDILDFGLIDRIACGISSASSRLNVAVWHLGTRPEDTGDEPISRDVCLLRRKLCAVSSLLAYVSPPNARD